MEKRTAGRSRKLADMVVEFDPRSNLEGLIETGLKMLDIGIGGGLAPGDLMVIGGSTNDVHMSLIWRLMSEAARGGVISAHMAAHESLEFIMCRTLAWRSGLSVAGVRSKQADPAVVQRALEEEKAELVQLFVEDVRGESVTSVCNTIRYYAELGAKLVSIDCLQGIEPEVWSGNRTADMELVFGELADCAHAARVALVIGSWCSGFQGTEPDLASCKGAESVATSVVLVWPGDKMLFAKVAKSKWTHVDQRFIIDVHPVSGALEGWHHNFARSSREPEVAEASSPVLVFGDDTGEPVSCPYCEDQYLHHTEIVVRSRSREDGPGVEVRIDKGKVATTDCVNFAGRRDDFSVRFWCEGCAQAFRLELRQHKGCTYCCFVPLGDAPEMEPPPDERSQ